MLNAIAKEKAVNQKLNWHSKSIQSHSELCQDIPVALTLATVGILLTAARM